ncbi:MAG: hypothetical protein JKY01_01025, partial [Pseudomonadales bacterium]|nr:hypothetical protein [Pseudomonadales bacterium]
MAMRALLLHDLSASEVLARVLWPFALLLALTGCADKPSYISIKNEMARLGQQEALPRVVEVKSMQKLNSSKKDGEFVVEVYFEQHFLLGLG